MIMALNQQAKYDHNSQVFVAGDCLALCDGICGSIFMFDGGLDLFLGMDCRLFICVRGHDDGVKVGSRRYRKDDALGASRVGFTMGHPFYKYES